MHFKHNSNYKFCSLSKLLSRSSTTKLSHSQIPSPLIRTSEVFFYELLRSSLEEFDFQNEDFAAKENYTLIFS